jgi:dCTP deaminase
MILSDKHILEQIEQEKIKIFSDKNDWKKQIHASSMDLRLGKFFKTYNHQEISILDPKKMAENSGSNSPEKITTLFERDENTPFVVHPGDFVLGVTAEKIALPNDIVARVEGRSSLGRLGIVVHSTAGFVDAGFEGTITLEITNLNTVPVALYPGMRVCQLAFETMSSEANVPYGQKSCSKYQNQEMPEESRVGNDPEFI